MSPAYRAHPEFGYFCLSRSFRRRALIALAAIAFGVFAGSQALRSGHETPDDGAAVIAPVRAAAVDAEAIAAVKAPSPAAETPAPPEAAKSGCEGETWTYLDGKCSASRRKPQGARGAVDVAPIATVPLGRGAPPPPASPVPAKPERLADASATSQTSSRDAAPGGAVPLPAPSPARKAELAADPVAAAPAASEPTERSVPATKEKPRAGHGPNGSRDLDKGNSGSRDGRSARSGQRSARADAAAGTRSPGKSSTGWERQLRTGENLLRAFLSPGI
jgi:hypothetical protein